MKQKDNDLLLKDLCARLPFGVKVAILGSGAMELSSIIKCDLGWFAIIDGAPTDFGIDEIKPYLRPMSSMTEEECYELHYIRSSFTDNWKYIKTPIPLSIANYNQVDWLNSHHFDFRGLLEKGLALEAPKGMYKI